MPHLAGSPDEIRARVPPVLAAWQFMRDEVLRGGLVEPELKRLCFRFAATGEEPEGEQTPRERLALRWAYAIVWDSDRADDDLWGRLHEAFSERELVDLGCAVGFYLGQRHFEQTLGA